MLLHLLPAMKISGFTFIRNAVKNDYPIKEAILSVLPICDEFVIAHGDSDDGTLALLQSIGSEKIRIIQTTWDDSQREGGRTFALETDKAYREISKDTDWAFYIQGDECIHENSLSLIKREMLSTLHDERIEGLLFKYLHFYGSYDYIGTSRNWYRNEIRAFKFNPQVHSYKDAQGFRKGGRKIRVKPIDAYVYHYGWVKPPKALTNKVRNFLQFYKEQDFINENFPENSDFDFHNAYMLERFRGSHPGVFQERLSKYNWQFNFDLVKLNSRMGLKYRVLHFIERLTGKRIGEYRNYTIVKK